MRSAAKRWGLRATTTLLSAVACSGLVACGGSADTTAPQPSVEPEPSRSAATVAQPSAPHATVVLAPSQVGASTVVPPTAPEVCPLDSLAIEAMPGSATSAPVVVVFRNETSTRCEVDLGRAWADAYDVEPSAWLAPGAEAELWGEGRACAAGQTAEWPLTVNGEAVTLALPTGAPCDVVPVAFFPR